MKIKLYNSLTHQTGEFNPIKGNEVRMYSCGPTVYNYAHIGNMRAFLFADLLQRVLRIVGGYDLKWVMNITDIDDKTIRDSSIGSDMWLDDMGQQSNDPMTNLKIFTKYYENTFFEDISTLGIDLNHFYSTPRATEYITQMKELITKIYNNGYAYISDGSIYFNVLKWRQDDIYGKLYRIDFDNFRTCERIDSDQYDREQACDFALWKARKEGEPCWEFEIDGNKCDGRPGWHIECSAMEYELLGLPFDIHTGGIDLKFPHHEDEIAQSKAGYGVEPTAFWCHNEFLEVEGEKMSKSLGNFFTLRDLTEKGIDPADIRFLMLSAHFGSKFNFTNDGLKSARKARLRVQEYIYSLFESSNGNLNPNITLLKEQIFSELADDLHTPKALAALFTFINNYPAEKLSQNVKPELIKLFEQLNGIFAVWQISERVKNIIVIPEELIILAEQRLIARKEKNFAESDRIRELITKAGYKILDTKDSYSLERIEN
jgi:cysteinyl-tRNA synthetase